MRNLVGQTSRNRCSLLPLEYQDVFHPANRIELSVVIIRDPVQDHPSLLGGEDLHELPAV
jgi:hypothetical protein